MSKFETNFSGEAFGQTAPEQAETVDTKLLEKLKLQINDQEMTREQLKDIVFSVLISEKLIEGLDKTLTECKFSVKEIANIKEELSYLTPEDIERALSTPWELRPRIFGSYKKDLSEGQITAKEMVSGLLNTAKEYGFTIGYHISPREIKRETNPREASQKTWSIKGYEVDDRDDKPMAYYSLDYAGLYRKRKGNYLYLIRAQPVEGSSHKVDTSNKWGRSSSLSIIDSIDLNEQDVDQKVSELASRLEKKKVAK